jgi:hypothetical protein
MTHSDNKTKSGQDSRNSLSSRPLGWRFWGAIFIALVLIVLTFLSFRYEYYVGVKRPGKTISVILFEGHFDLELRFGKFVGPNLEFGAVKASKLVRFAYPKPQRSVLGVSYFDSPWPMLRATRLWYVQFSMLYPIGVALALIWLAIRSRKRRRTQGFEVEIAAKKEPPSNIQNL